MMSGIHSGSTQLLTIPGRLPGRNEAEKAARSHWSVVAKFKSDYTLLVLAECRKQRIKPVDGLVNIEVTFYEPNRRRDEDNVIGGGIKYIMDGLVQAGVIKGDGQKYVRLKINPVEIDRSKPRIEVRIGSVRASETLDTGRNL